MRELPNWIPEHAIIRQSSLFSVIYRTNVSQISQLKFNAKCVVNLTKSYKCNNSMGFCLSVINRTNSPNLTQFDIICKRNG